MKKKNVLSVDKSKGWIALYRRLTKHKIFFDVNHFRIFMWLLLETAWEEHWTMIDGHRIIVEKGTICITWEDLSNALGYPVSTLRRHINIMCGITYDHIISKTRYKHHICIKVNNYSKWQSI
jgi:hypothetical protein